MTDTEEQIAKKFIENHYQVIIKEMIGVYPIEMAKDLNCDELKKAKKCALISVKLLLDHFQKNSEEIEKWKQIQQSIENF